MQTDLLKKAVALHQAGDPAGALALYQQLLASQPRQPDVLHLMGLAMRTMGHAALALRPVEAAIALRPDSAPFHATHGRLLGDLGEHDQAEQALRRSLALDPGVAATWVGLGLSLSRQEREDEASTCHRHALALDRDNVDAHTNLARLLLDGGDTDGAVRHARAALQARPGHLPAAINGALALQRAGEPGAALTLLGAGLEPPRLRLRATLQLEVEDFRGLLVTAAALLSHEDTASWHWLTARALRGLGRTAEALDALTKGLAAHPGDIDLARARLDWLAAASPEDLSLGQELLLTELLADPLQPAQQLADVALWVWVSRHPWLETGEVPDDGLAALEEPLARHLLARAEVRSLAVERTLAVLREQVLEVDRPVALASLAAQAWRNEYLHGPVDAPFPRSLLGAPWPDDQPEPAADDPLHPLWVAQVQDVAAERALDIAELGDTDDAVTTEVRAQYEASPYPRWQGLAPRPRARIEQLLERLFPWQPWRPEPRDSLEVLLAGCGTGHHAALLATGLEGAHITAVDLSSASLRYAARQLDLLGIDNVRLLRGDLLGLDALDATFDHVESVGVLHHLADPAAGLAALVRRARPGATLKIGLYTRRSREAIVAAHALFTDLPRTADGARQARSRLLALPPEHPARGALASPDCYATSAVRDLVLHACEHRFHPSEVGALLDAQGLVPLGVEVEHASLVADWDARFPEDPQRLDFTNWDRLESEHPMMFAGMIRVWCRAPA